MKPWPFDSVLVANRGEIALRIVRSVRALGLRSIAVFSDADAQAPHVLAADEAVCLGAAPVAESYLNAQAILQAARKSNAGAIHPGYGFLSENAAFAQSCVQAGLVFVGPGAEAIRVMGNKRLAKERMQAAGVPCIPGYLGPGQDLPAFMAAARDVGYPVMVKAAAGGGGRGMRLVDQEAGLAAALESAESEARNAFGDGTLYLEKALRGARHVEVQVLADCHGHTVHLGERDCSVQRRHQKIVEEAPSPAVDDKLRARMTADAVTAAQAIGYQNAGTVEFLLDASGRYYFLEMNTRLQVEHPVTECVTGLDLVALQLRIAAGEMLPFTQANVAMRGHAMEVRLYAEDPQRAFMPQTGTVTRWRTPQGEGVRVDAGVREGLVVTTHYDPMLAKIIAHGRDREEARRRLAAAVEATEVHGVQTNKDYLVRILRHPAFVASQAATDFIGTHAEALAAPTPSALARGVAALLMCWPAGMALRDWREAGSGQWTVRLGGAPVRLERDRSGQATAHVDGRAIALDVLRQADGELLVLADGTTERFAFMCDRAGVQLSGREGTHLFIEVLPDKLRGATRVGDGRMLAPMSGRVVRIHASVGDVLEARSCVLVVEAMKMEHEIPTDVAGEVATIDVQVGAQVRARQLLATMRPVTASVV